MTSWYTLSINISKQTGEILTLMISLWTTSHTCTQISRDSSQSTIYLMQSAVHLSKQSESMTETEDILARSGSSLSMITVWLQFYFLVSISMTSCKYLKSKLVLERIVYSSSPSYPPEVRYYKGKGYDPTSAWTKNPTEAKGFKWEQQIALFLDKHIRWNEYATKNVGKTIYQFQRFYLFPPEPRRKKA